MSKRVLVTGAGGVLGSAVCEYLQQRTIDVVGVDLSEAVPSGCKDFIGGVDLTDSVAAEAAFAKAAEGGGIDGLANIAGGFSWVTIADGGPEIWEKMFRMNTLTALNACRAVLPHLKAGASIVNVGAAATMKAGAGMGAYTASKSGVARLTEALAEELKADGIRANAILPSIIDTPTNRKDMGDADAGKWVKPEELAAVVAFLLSDDASAITGASVPVTGRC